MPTDYSCQAAAELAAGGIAPVRALWAPVRPPAPREEAVPVVIRTFLEPARSQQSAGGTDERAERDDRSSEIRKPPPALSPSMGAAVLLIFLDGLQADLTGTLVEWYAELPVRLPRTLGVPTAAAPDPPPTEHPSGWQALAGLQTSAQEVLTTLVGRSHRSAARPGELDWRLALVEDTFAGALRRMAVPADISVHCAADLSDAAGSLFGLSRPAPPASPRAAAAHPAH